MHRPSGFFLLFFAALLVLMPLRGEETRIRGGHPSYAGASLRLYIEDNPFLDNPLWHEELRCNRSGNFDIKFDLDEDSFLRISTGAHLLGLYVQAGGVYELQLPEKSQLGYQEMSSPYFSPVEILLSPEGQPEDLNHQLMAFESLFNELNSRVIQDRMMRNKTNLDSIISILDSSSAQGEDSWLARYRKYKTGILVLNAGNTGLEEVSTKYMEPEPDPGHPAFMELFKLMFTDFLVYYDHTKDGKGILHQLNQTQNLDSIRRVIMRHPAVANTATCDLLLLQEIPGLFHSDQLRKEAVLLLLDSLALHPSAPDFGRYALEIRQDMASLIPGNTPPDFRLKGTDGQRYGPGDFAGKYTYLMFCTPDHYGCMMEYPFLESYVKKHADYLNIICIMVAEDEDAVQDFMKRNSYSFRALYYEENRRLLDQYKVRAFPVAYLLDPKGQLLLSPAPLPSDQFEFVLFRIMRSRGEI